MPGADPSRARFEVSAGSLALLRERHGGFSRTMLWRSPASLLWARRSRVQRLLTAAPHPAGGRDRQRRSGTAVRSLQRHRRPPGPSRKSRTGKVIGPSAFAPTQCRRAIKSGVRQRGAFREAKGIVVGLRLPDLLAELPYLLGLC